MSSSRLFSLLLVPALTAALVGAAPREASAQCFGPDGLTGPCCMPAPLNLPNFPAVSMPALGACWDRCTQGLQRPLFISWGAPGSGSCSEFSAPLNVFDQASGQPLLTGKMLLDYTRTWMEIDPAGNPMQVWRFTVKADLSIPPGALLVNCATPPCLAPIGPHSTAFFYGYMDYAACSAAGGFQNVLVLSHAADRFIHAPGLSDKPGVFHPGQSYAIIAPHSAVQPFIPGNAIAAGGVLIAEATRNVNVPGIPPGVCMTEDRIAQGQMTKLGAGCLANIANNPKQHTLRQFQGKTSCVNAAGVQGGFQSLNLNFPVVPWFHMVTSSVGTWSNPNVYPGKEEAWVDEGLFVHQDACTGDFFEVKYGGSTRGGWTAMVLGGLVTPNFTDIVDNYTAPLSGPFPLPILGSIRSSEHLIYVNEP
jgi:hypothetical protein